MARTVNFSKKAEKIKEMIDGLVSEMNQTHVATLSNKIKLTDINFEETDVVTLMQIQARISRIILEKSK